MTEVKWLRSIPVRNRLGEGILWDEIKQQLWWTDIQSRHLHRYAWQFDEMTQFELPERLGSLGFVHHDDRLICAFASGFALYDPGTAEVTWLYRPEQDYTGTRLNDGRVDRQGRFWAGSMVEHEAARDADGKPVSGSLYSVDGARQCRTLTGIGISNSLCWSPDSTTMYFADTCTDEIRAYAFNAKTGLPGDSTLFAKVAAPGAPDGSTVDADGYLWNAQWGGSRIVRYAPSGEVDLELPVPVSRPTCVCFGGPDLDLLFVTSATEGMTVDQISQEPEAGNVLIYQTSVTGLPENRYRGGTGNA